MCIQLNVLSVHSIRPGPRIATYIGWAKYVRKTTTNYFLSMKITNKCFSDSLKSILFKLIHDALN